MSQYLLLKQGTIHNAVDEEAFVADILIEDGKIKKIACKCTCKCQCY